MIRTPIKLVISFLILLVAFSYLAVPIQAKSSQLVYKIPIHGTIDSGMVHLVKKGIKQAQAARADLIVLDINTYGGLVDSAIKIKDSIFASSLPIVTYVSGRAWSAGALIALAGNELAMTPGSSIGAAETRPQEEKYISALRKEFKATAQRRDKNGKLAAAMVDKEISIPEVSKKGNLLTLTVQEAISHKIADLKVVSFKELLAKMKLSRAQVFKVKLTLTEKFAEITTNPASSIILLTVGFIALAFEALAPGWGVGGAIGLLSLGLFFSGYIINGVASWGLIILFMVGIILMLLEVLVIPGFGVAGISGLVAIFSSLYFVFPTSNIALKVIATTLVLSIVGIWLIIKKFGTTALWSKVSLAENQTKKAGYVTSKLKTEKLLGAQGKVINVLRPSGIVNIKGQRLNVVSEGNYIKEGKLVEVIEVTGNRIVVREITKEE
ncbi:membrane-bound serine protease (ClpP class) [Halobacteroides halobius DSM 5150]|uniref:Membrane-bound serine protease (ClpP class) n=1 Tax=Halobacteroides halobius (strain ATCC 35273 / DSM 5150 / MD-1) TaxID=748449 RepID=L0K6L9_HALHC|nr:NfeD family protein [Halobacteroides halobius]AGB40902.1 membrane-bound serine protease (ClpP class) [Halobacteroides halobius DSM 5150]